MKALPNFDPDVRWYTGQGCMICGSNYSPQGAEAGIQAVDFQMSDQFGHFGLCYSHAREVGAIVGMVDKAELNAVHVYGEAVLAEIMSQQEVMAVERKEMAEDRAVVERLVARFQPEPTAEPLPVKPKRQPKPGEAERFVNES